MTKLEVRQQKKNETLNRIIFIYSKHFKYMNNSYDDSYVEQRDEQVKKAYEKLQRDINISSIMAIYGINSIRHFSSKCNSPR